MMAGKAHMITKLLIANRGEIACRVIATARRMGIATVAVFSDADAAAKHVAMADEAVRIGPAPVGESYLRGEAIIAAAQATGAQAIHPGYGFLSENPQFADAVEAAGLIFVGPPASAIRAMGLKDAAKRLMEKAGVPVVPGYHGEAQELIILASKANEIGYPVLIKARAGGGGKGMRKVDAPEQFANALSSAQREAKAAFGDERVLVEKYVATPRHIEIQVFADGHGNVVHLFERDCSLQRRHQKVIEEAPAPGMSEAVRAAMGKAAVDAARAIGYCGAGTVEFIADGTSGLRPDGFWFMEMNTRLQVEHPVTEAITGLDLVELQLRVASGDALPFAQSDLAISGHAFEARIYAEDAAHDFLPQTGRIAAMMVPEAANFTIAPVRIDSGVRDGDVISPFYDPMIAKLVTHGPDRASALAALRGALAHFQIAGTITNTAFLGALARNADFALGKVDTGLIARHIDTLTRQQPLSETMVALAALAALNLLAERTDGPFARLTGFRHWGPAEHIAALELPDGRRAERRVAIESGGRFTVTGGNDAVTFDLLTRGDTIRFGVGGIVQTARVVRHGAAITIFSGDDQATFATVNPLETSARDEASGDHVVSPMPGLVKQLSARAGATVRKGEVLLILEAMKMEHALTAPRDGRIEELRVSEGSQVEAGMVLVSLEAEA
jgi:3-methylcrotonyl-CoA carboxylase alpha subunit